MNDYNTGIIHRKGEEFRWFVIQLIRGKPITEYNESQNASNDNHSIKILYL